LRNSCFNLDEDDKDIESLKIQKKALLSSNLRYDPYSLTAEEDYEKLKEEVAKFDIVSILNSELSKTRIHSPLMKKLLKTIVHLEKDSKKQAILNLIYNFEILFPVIPNVLMLIKKVFNDIDEETQEYIQDFIRTQIRANYIFQIDLNICYEQRKILNA